MRSAGPAHRFSRKTPAPDIASPPTGNRQTVLGTESGAGKPIPGADATGCADGQGIII